MFLKYVQELVFHALQLAVEWFAQKRYCLWNKQLMLDETKNPDRMAFLQKYIAIGKVIGSPSNERSSSAPAGSILPG